MAHYDSKSQTISLPARMLLFVILVAGAAGYAFLAFFTQVMPAAGEASLAMGALAVLSGVPLILLTTGNKSPGSLDNASGAGLLVHLAEVLAPREALHERIKITFVATGAEEYALMGARAYLQSQLSPPAGEGRLPDFQLINLDGPGSDGKLNISSRWQPAGQGETGLSGLIQRCCEELAIPYTRYSPPALMMDHMPFAEAGLDALTISSFGRSALSVHTRKDTADNLSIKGMDQAGQTVICAVSRLTRVLQDSG
jgi:Zn-dependent M28 family amino/carboxypeptidase